MLITASQVVREDSLRVTSFTFSHYVTHFMGFYIKGWHECYFENSNGVKLYVVFAVPLNVKHVTKQLVLDRHGGPVAKALYYRHKLLL